jgi:hypothetical protein
MEKQNFNKVLVQLMDAQWECQQCRKYHSGGHSTTNTLTTALTICFDCCPASNKPKGYGSFAKWEVVSDEIAIASFRNYYVGYGFSKFLGGWYKQRGKMTEWHKERLRILLNRGK